MFSFAPAGHTSLRDKHLRPQFELILVVPKRLRESQRAGVYKDGVIVTRLTKDSTKNQTTN